MNVVLLFKKNVKFLKGKKNGKMTFYVRSLFILGFKIIMVRTIIITLKILYIIIL